MAEPSFANYRYTYRRAVRKATTLAHIITFLVFGICLLSAPLTSGGWSWDSANALGFMAFAGMLYLFLDRGAGRRNRIHQWAGYTIGTLLIGHVGWFVVTDSTIWHYLSWDAPWYMLTGIGALFAVAAIVILALPTWRRTFGQSRPSFRNWHYTLSLLGVSGALLHISGSGFYVDNKIEIALYAALTVCIAYLGRSGYAPQINAQAAHLATTLTFVLAFVAMKGFLT